MTRTIVLDSGAVIAAENSDSSLTRLIEAARTRRALVLIPSGVIAETWRGASPHPNISRLMKTVDAFPPLDFDAAKRIGTRLGQVSGPSVIDGSVVDVALRNTPSLIATSDPDDLRELLKHVPKADIEIYVL